MLKIELRCFNKNVKFEKNLSQIFRKLEKIWIKKQVNGN